MYSLELREVAKYYGQRRVLERVSFVLPERSCLVVTGSNGTGKTTLLRIMAGLLPVTRGEVIARERERVLPPTEYRRRIGMVGPDIVLYGELTAVENLVFYARMRGIDMDSAAICQLLSEVCLGGRGSDRASTFSTGMKQRLKFAYALMHRPKYLFLDEPGSSFDAEGLALLDSIVSRQTKEGLLVIATNQEKEAGYGDQVLRLGE